MEYHIKDKFSRSMGYGLDICWFKKKMSLEAIAYAHLYIQVKFEAQDIKHLLA